MSKKDKLLEELAKLQHKDGRKVRADKGKPRRPYVRNTITPRTDAGIARLQYSTDGPAYHKKLFDQFIRLHTDTESGTGDYLNRDVNMIFPPNITNYYKKVTPKSGVSYRSSVRRKNHPEELRWNWFMAEYKNAKTSWDKAHWEKIITEWYFITKEDLEYDLWTYSEWAWSYVNAIAGHPNRSKAPGFTKIILLYDAYAEGAYGQIKYDDKGQVIWV